MQDSWFRCLGAYVYVYVVEIRVKVFSALGWYVFRFGYNV